VGQEWVYKATPTIANLEDTRRLAIDDGFLAKAAYEKPRKNGRHSRADYVKAVHTGDIIYFYFRDHGLPAHEAVPIGAFEVVVPPAESNRFVWPVEDTCLARVVDRAFEARLKRMGYDHDPKLPFVTGWVLKHVARDTPDYDRGWFPGQQVLRRFGRR
jgi:hypothetical protein